MNTAPLFRPQTTTRRKLPIPTRLLRTRFNPTFPASTSMFSESTFPRAVLVLVAISISALILYSAASSLRFISSSSGYSFDNFPSLRYRNNNSGSDNSDPKLSVSFFPLAHFSAD